jgi:hypothetical protein
MKYMNVSKTVTYDIEQVRESMKDLGMDCDSDEDLIAMIEGFVVDDFRGDSKDLYWVDDEGNEW